MKKYSSKVGVRPASAFVNVAQLKRHIPPLDFYSRELTAIASSIRTEGWVCGGICPFHADKRTGSFRVNLCTGGFKCFSCGASGGDIIDFAQRRHGFSFSRALEYLMREFGVQA